MRLWWFLKLKLSDGLYGLAGWLEPDLKWVRQEFPDGSVGMHREPV